MTERRQFVGHSSTAEAAQFTGRSREITVDMQAETLRVHDGITPGGYPLMRADMANLDPSVLNGKLSVFERLANKVTTITQYVTNAAYPTALAVWKLCLTKANVALDNINDAGKAVIRGLANEVAASLIGQLKGSVGFPDYSKPTPITSGYVASKNGWIRVKTPTGEDTTPIYVDGLDVAGGHGGSNKDNEKESFIFPISAGSVVTWSVWDVNAVFLPIKEY